MKGNTTANMFVEMNVAKDWIYVVCTSIQTVLAIVAFLAANWYQKRRERREEEERSEREDREMKERLDREIREKISKVFSERYYTIENEIEMMSKTPKRPKTTPIIRRGMIYTSFDVLAYMCEASQRNTFQTPALDSFCEALDKIARFFQCFRAELPPTDGKCPKNIKEEMGPIIADIGNNIFSFVSKERQEAIKWVLGYFEAKLIDENVTNPQDTNLQDTIPYIKLLRFEQPTDSSQISFDNAEICFIGRAQVINDIQSSIPRKCLENSNGIIDLLN